MPITVETKRLMNWLKQLSPQASSTHSTIPSRASKQNSTNICSRTGSNSGKMVPRVENLTSSCLSSHFIQHCHGPFGEYRERFRLLQTPDYACAAQTIHYATQCDLTDSWHPTKYQLPSLKNNGTESSYVQEKDVSVDESLLLYKGRLGYKQYLPKKTARFGIKFYQLCESSSGYIWNRLIYTGKDMPLWIESSNYKSTTNIVDTFGESS
ncbi:PiggyBac transposable element-derived protein 4 [Araneus ventricosus]|uniref:PiggyBac transposable element-derived protein 4 n=1 Tax=Araneus ventricosus TaxID=182803 RepID=A0A4Y2W758_ARAVE|nr:PiggyBac transposable element-derived protein 4 [Araneus ventricosus]